MKCPKCHSQDVVIIDQELGFVKCKKCGYDELEEDLSSFGERKNQKEKGSYNPYKTGGQQRSRKK